MVVIFISYKKYIIIISICLLIILAGCGDDEKESTDPVCESDSECSTSLKCNEAICSGGACITKTIPDCCGNAICEESSDENDCNCKEDCEEVCVGEVKFVLSTGQTQTAKYFKHECGPKDLCIIKYDTSKIDPRQAYHELKLDSIVVGMMVDYIQPFEINHGELKLELQLKDVGDLVKMPITIKEVRIMESTLLLGRLKDINQTLSKLGEEMELEIPISYSMKLPEEQKSVKIVIDYEFIKFKKLYTKTNDANNQPIYDYIDDKLQISSFNQQLAERVYFIDPDYDIVKIDFSQD